jgi:hypothetical protein
VFDREDKRTAFTEPAVNLLDYGLQIFDVVEHQRTDD